ncbi:MAG TPA: hypothetical protein VEL03_11130 [Streptosporangiaceae bacterium]|nr:hypothetical protein [Streptosporangiaceae bacterium]
MIMPLTLIIVLTCAGTARLVGEMFGSRNNPVGSQRARDVTVLKMQRAVAAARKRDRSAGGTVNRPTARRGPWLVCRRHIDQMRVSSAICRTFC